MTEVSDYFLSEKELNTFNNNGYSGPHELFSEDQAMALNNILDVSFAHNVGPNDKNPLQSRHMDIIEVREASLRNEVCDRVASILGDDLIMWASYFFEKQSGGLEIPWHQDINYWPLEPEINISAWVALDPVTKDNSCVQLIPGSHNTIVPHVEAPKEMQFAEMADPSHFDDSNKVYIELKPGEFFLFNEKTLHKSEVNNSDMRRRGMTFRYSIPSVKVFHDQSPLHVGHKALLARGVDHSGFNKYC